MIPLEYTEEGRLFAWLQGQKNVTFVVELLDEGFHVLSHGVVRGRVVHEDERRVTLSGYEWPLSPYAFGGETVHWTLYRFQGFKPLKVKHEPTLTVAGKAPRWMGVLTLRRYA